MANADQSRQEATLRFKYGVGLTFKTGRDATELKKLWQEKLGGLELVPKGNDLYWTRVSVIATDETEAKAKAWAFIVKHFDVEPFDEEIVFKSPGPVPPETQPPETEPPIIQWKVELHCEIPFSAGVLTRAWQTRLPNVAISINFRDSDENKTIFDLVVRVGASSNARAASMASDLLKRHFQTIEILEMTANPV